MANHSFVTTRKWLNADKVEKDLNGILERRFGNKIPYTREGDYFNIGFDYPYTIPMWVENVHKLEFRNGGPDWRWWVQAVLHNEFALLYNGTISDEGVSEKWKGEKNKYPTFKSYLKARFGHLKNPMKKVLEYMSLFIIDPPEIKKTYNGTKGKR